jgi:hypothetical protein
LEYQVEGQVVVLNPLECQGIVLFHVHLTRSITKLVMHMPLAVTSWSERSGVVPTVLPHIHLSGSVTQSVVLMPQRECVTQSLVFMIQAFTLFLECQVVVHTYLYLIIPDTNARVCRYCIETPKHSIMTCKRTIKIIEEYGPTQPLDHVWSCKTTLPELQIDQSPHL